MHHRSPGFVRFALAAYVLSLALNLLHFAFHADHDPHIAISSPDGNVGPIVRAECDDSCTDPTHHHHGGQLCQGQACPLCKHGPAKPLPIGRLTIIALLGPSDPAPAEPRTACFQRIACALFARGPPTGSAS